MAGKASFTVGVFAGITVGNTSTIVLRRRVETGSIVPGQSFKGNWELPGGGVKNVEGNYIPYDYLAEECAREVLEEMGIEIAIDFPQVCMPFTFKGPNGYDLALVMPVVISDLPVVEMDKLRLASLVDLNRLAREFVPAKKDPPTEGKGLLSGWGKRMHCMGLSVFLSDLFPAVVNQRARDTLAEIQRAW